MIRGDDFYLKAFGELSSCRQFGQCIGPIPWYCTIEYARVHHLDEDMTEVFTVVIRELDEAYLENQREQQT